MRPFKKQDEIKRFNEAEALKPRIPMPASWTPSRVDQRFNEAEALKPRIPSGRRSAAASGRSLQ